jgi:hypothetical protein
MTVMPITGKSSVRKANSSNEITERIRQRAYELYEQGAKANALDNWLQAETEILGMQKLKIKTAKG